MDEPLGPNNVGQRRKFGLFVKLEKKIKNPCVVISFTVISFTRHFFNVVKMTSNAFCFLKILQTWYIMHRTNFPQGKNINLNNRKKFEKSMLLYPLPLYSLPVLACHVT